MAPRNILYITHTPPDSSGSTFSLLHLLRELDRSDFCPHLALFTPRQSPNQFDELGVSQLCVPLPRFIHNASETLTPLHPRSCAQMVCSFMPSRRLARILHERNIALVHLNSSVLVSAALTCHLSGIPVVWHVREVIAPGFFGIRRRLLTASIRKWSDAIVCISEDEATPFLDEPKTLVAYNPVDLQRFDPDCVEPQRIRQELGFSPDTCVIGFVAAVAHHKGIFELVEAAEILLKSVRQPVRFLIVGGGSPSLRYDWNTKAKCLNRLRAYVDGRVEMERVIRAKGLEKHFLLTGHRTDIPNLVSAMDIVAFPSRLAAIGRAAIEAAALAKPVVAASESRKSGLVQDRKTGLLVPPRSPQDLASALEYLIRNPGQARAMGEAGREYAVSQFDSRRYAKRIMEVYSRLLEGEDRASSIPLDRDAPGPRQKTRMKGVVA